MKEATDGVHIIPAIMPKQFSDIERETDRVAMFTTTVQIDVMDGVFVPSISWPYGADQWKEAEQLAQGILQLPAHGSLQYEAHLMVSDPDRIGGLLAQGGVKRIIMHVESLTGVAVDRMCSSWRALGTEEIGIAILFDTPIELLRPHMAHVQFIQVMGIKRAGFQGESFESLALRTVAAIQKEYPAIPIEFDGGANESTIREIAGAGVARIVVGSALLGAANPQEVYGALLRAVDKRA